MTSLLRPAAKRLYNLFLAARHLYWRTPLMFHPRALKRSKGARVAFRSGEGLWLHLGCGRRRLPGFINIDQMRGQATDYVGDIGHLPIRAGTVERIETYHVIEHIPHPQVDRVLAHWRDLLAPGGVLVLECPDFDRAVQDYSAGESRYARLGTIFGWQRYPGDYHYWGYGETGLTDLCLRIGFDDVRAEEPWDYHALDEPCLRIVASKEGTQAPDPGWEQRRRVLSRPPSAPRLPFLQTGA